MFNYGDIFREKFGKDPRKLSIEEIEKLAVKAPNTLTYIPNNLAIARGEVFKISKYYPDAEVEKALKELRVKK